jgi:hypothetical protein
MKGKENRVYPKISKREILMKSRNLVLKNKHVWFKVPTKLRIRGI